MKKTGRKGLALLLCAALLALGMPLSASAAGRFTDVPETAWYAPAVEYCLEHKLMSGTGGGKFDPQGSMTRAMFVQVLYNMAGRPVDSASVWGFTDLDGAQWYTDAALWAYRHSIANGTEKGKFSPLLRVTREQMAQFLYRYAKAAGNDTDFIAGATTSYTDFQQTSPGAQIAMDWAVTKGILRGDQNTRLRPKDTATRAEAAQVLANAGAVLEKWTVQPALTRPSATAVEWGLTDYPKVDGSTSTLLLSQLAFHEMHDWWDGSLFPSEASKTVPSYRKLIGGEVDLILVPYASQDVLNAAKEKGVELEFHKVAAEALVFITPKENPTENITEEQVRSIYRDYAIRDWKVLGGPDRELVPLCRNADSGSQSQLENLILKGDPMHPDIEKNFIVLAMGDMLRQTLHYHEGGDEGAPTNSYALGYTLFTYLSAIDNSTVASRLNMLSYNGIKPTRESLRDGSYPLTDGYYAVVRGDTPGDAPARKLIDWLQSGEADKAMEDYGYLPAS